MQQLLAQSRKRGTLERAQRISRCAHASRAPSLAHLYARSADRCRSLGTPNTRASSETGVRSEAVTHIAQAYPDRVEVRGRDLAGDLMGRVSFTEYFHLLLTGREPSEEQRFFLDLLLVAIAEHGMTPTSVAARMTLAADPGSLQGAVAAGILGCGPVVLGPAAACARLRSGEHTS